MQIGLVGLPNSTKTTIFNALTKSHAETAAYSTAQIETHVAVVRVPDPRVDTLTEIFCPAKTTYAQIQYNDIGGLHAGIGQEGGLDGQLRNTIAANDALLHIVRAFKDERVPHPAGSVDAERDLAVLEFEFLMADLDIVERRMERLARDLAKHNKQADRLEFDLVMRLKENLEQEIPIRDIPLSVEQQREIRGYQFLTAKPVLVVLNVGDEGSDNPAEHIHYAHRASNVICLRGEIEMEIAQLDDQEAAEFLAEYGISEPGLNRMIRLSYDLLGLHSFFTVGEDEVRAWTIPQGATASRAAGVIHSDLERGFIRAQVVGYDDLVAAGSMAEVRKRGQLRLEGKDYVVQDGDVMNILFNV